MTHARAQVTHHALTLQAVLILWRLQQCTVLFALASLAKSVAAKLLSTTFYRCVSQCLQCLQSVRGNVRAACANA